MNMNTKLETLRALVEFQQNVRLVAEGMPFTIAYERGAKLVTSTKYTKLNIGPNCNMSGRYMVDNATGNIYGIKGYSVINKAKQYGNLDTIHNWDWSDYLAVPIGVSK